MRVALAAFAAWCSVAAAQPTSAPPVNNPNAPVIAPRKSEAPRRIVVERNPPVRFDPRRKRSPYIDELMGLPGGFVADPARETFALDDEPSVRLQPIEPIEPIKPIQRIQPIVPLRP